VSSSAPGARSLPPQDVTAEHVTSLAGILDDPVHCHSQLPHPIAIDMSARCDVVWLKRSDECSALPARQSHSIR